MAEQSFIYYFSPDFSPLYLGRVFYGEKEDSLGRRGFALRNGRTPEELGEKMKDLVIGIETAENGHDEVWQRHNESMGFSPRPLNADEEKRFLKALGREQKD